MNGETISVKNGLDLPSGKSISIFILIVIFAGAIYFVVTSDVLSDAENNVPIQNRFNPSKEGVPQQLEAVVIGTAKYRGLMLTNIVMSSEYPEVIESGTIENKGKSTLNIIALTIAGRCIIEGGDETEIGGGYEGFLQASGISVAKDGTYNPPLVLKPGNSMEVSLRFFDNNGKESYYVKDGATVKDVSFRAIGEETGVSALISTAKAIIN